MMPRFRPTFLGRCLGLGVSLLIFFGAVGVLSRLAEGRLLTSGVLMGFLIAVILSWFLLIEVGLLGSLILYVIGRGIERAGGSGSGLFFVDVEQERDKDVEAESSRLEGATRDNSTIR